MTNSDAHSGTYSLLTTGRQAAFDGAAINAAGKLCNGSRYTVSVWVKLAPGEPDSQIRVSLQRSLGTTTTFHTVIGNTTVTAGQWVRLRTTYDFVFSYQSLTLYVESASGTASFLIDDFDLTFVPPPVAERDIAVCARGVLERLRGRCRGMAGRPGRRTRVPPLEALQQRDLRERHEVGHAAAGGRDLRVRERRRPGGVREGGQSVGSWPHPRVARPEPGVVVHASTACR